MKARVSGLEKGDRARSGMKVKSAVNLEGWETRGFIVSECVVVLRAGRSDYPGELEGSIQMDTKTFNRRRLESAALVEVQHLDVRYA
jgi:hypothetical protein